MELSLTVAGNRDLRAAGVRRITGEAASTPDEQIIEVLLFRAVMRSYENQYHQHKDGTFDDAMWEGYLENIRDTFSAPKYIELWKANRTRYSTGYAKFIESLLIQIRGDDGTPSNMAMKTDVE
jgi:hypothetical protein